MLTIGASDKRTFITIQDLSASTLDHHFSRLSGAGTGSDNRNAYTVLYAMQIK